MAQKRKEKKSTSRRAARKVVQPSISNRATVGANEEFDRETTVTARSSGVSVSATARIRVIQLGMREPFIPSDQTEALETSDGTDFGVLKQ